MPDDVFSYLFSPKPGGPAPTYDQLQTRRKLALQIMANSRKGYPKTIGEGLTAIGDAIGERGIMNQLDVAERAKALQDQEVLKGTGIGGAAPEAQQSEVAAPLKTAYADEGDTPTPTVAPTPTLAGYRPAPAYLRTALEQDVADPERRAYLGQLAGKEAQSADEVSPTGAAGPFQFTRGTGAQYGLMPGGQDMRGDIHGSIAAVQNLTDDNAATLTKMLGRPPSPGELALAHQQGAVTAARMLTGAGNAPANNLAVNNVNPAASPQAAAAKIMGYYGMPGQPLATPRDTIAAQLAQRQAGPQPNRPSAALAFSGSPTVPGDLPSEITTGASAIRPAPRPPSQIQAAPVQVAQAAQTLRPPVVPQPTDQMDKISRALSMIGDPLQRDALTRKYQELQQNQMNTYNQQMEGYKYSRTQAEPEKVRAADIATRFGGQAPYQKFNDEMATGHGAIQPLANTLPMYDQAKTALKNSYTGAGAEIKLDAAKMLRGLGVPGDYSPAVATEILRSRMSAIAAGFVKGTVGSQNISNQDVAFVEKAYSGKLDMEPESLRKLLNIAQEAAIKTVNQHNDRLFSVANDPVADRGLRNMYRVPMQYGNDAEILKQQGQDPKIREYFDQKYGKGHAAAVLKGVSYGD